MLRKWILTICLLCFVFSILCPFVQADPNEPNKPDKSKDGWIVSVMALDNSVAFGDDGSNIFLRGGYRYGVLEAFAGLEAQRAEKFEFGFLLHSRDIAEPNSVAVISPLLTNIFNPDMVITGYSGLHWMIEDEETYSGAIIGIDAKSDIESPLSLRAEIHYENNLDKDIRFFAGMCWKF